MVYPLQEKLHISGMDDRAPSLARRWRLGCEDITFSYAPMLDDPAALPQAANRVAGLSRLWLHAPFAELIPCAEIRNPVQHPSRRRDPRRTGKIHLAPRRCAGKYAW